MEKRRKVDQNTKHLKGRVVLSDNEGITFPSAEEIFLRRLEEKILMEAKGFKYAGIKLEHFTLEIK